MEQPTTSYIDPRDTSYATPLSPPSSVSGSMSQTESISKRTSTPKKKRKSWGQVLPEPTTALPPRKRAKTDAEKQQRMYERVQRNRAAAHNSRMRKQNEMDDALHENNQLKQDLHEARLELERLKEENARLQNLPKQEPDLEIDHYPVFEKSEASDAPPSLTSGPSDDASSPESDPIPSEPSPSFMPDLSSDTKHLDDSHSAEMCSQQWTSGLRSTPRRAAVLNTALT